MLKFRGTIIVGVILIFSGLMVISPAIAAPNQNADSGPPELEKIVFIHYYKPSHDTDDLICNDACEGNDDDKTFRLISGGIKWANLPIVYLISDDFSPQEESAIEESADTWDKALDDVSGSSIDLFVDSPDGTDKTQDDAGVNDSDNIIVKGDLASNIIGVTSFWYNPSTKEVVDADMVLNYVDFSWSTTGGDHMDVQNIVTHELGHFLVLDDLSSPKTFDLTMYGSSDDGEIKSRTLGVGDEQGVVALYAGSGNGEVDEDGPDCTKSKSKKWC